MSRVSVYKPARGYKPRKLVQGFCVPTKEGSGEQLICTDCGPKPFAIEPPQHRVDELQSAWEIVDEFGSTYGIPFIGDWPFPVYGERPKFIPVTFDGRVKCSRCGEFLTRVGA